MAVYRNEEGLIVGMKLEAFHTEPVSFAVHFEEPLAGLTPDVTGTLRAFETPALAEHYARTGETALPPVPEPVLLEGVWAKVEKVNGLHARLTLTSAKEADEWVDEYVYVSLGWRTGVVQEMVRNRTARILSFLVGVGDRFDDRLSVEVQHALANGQIDHLITMLDMRLIGQKAYVVRTFQRAHDRPEWFPPIDAPVTAEQAANWKEAHGLRP